VKRVQTAAAKAVLDCPDGLIVFGPEEVAPMALEATEKQVGWDAIDG